LAESDQVFNQETASQIGSANSDILLVAYQPPKQELWIAENLGQLNAKVVIGLGGTFDYIAGKRDPAPEFMVKFGLEWLWRLITQPWRIKRMWRAIIEFSILILEKKLKQLHE
jgi:N-acetylglucosaminyldiphosphoundecaprenol N-acetyl-beta-D-mannosaminyltransferase